MFLSGDNYSDETAKAMIRQIEHLTKTTVMMDDLAESCGQDRVESHRMLRNFLEMTGKALAFNGGVAVIPEYTTDEVAGDLLSLDIAGGLIKIALRNIKHGLDGSDEFCAQVDAIFKRERSDALATMFSCYDRAKSLLSWNMPRFTIIMAGAIMQYMVTSGLRATPHWFTDEMLLVVRTASLETGIPDVVTEIVGNLCARIAEMPLSEQTLALLAGWVASVKDNFAHYAEGELGQMAMIKISEDEDAEHRSAIEVALTDLHAYLMGNLMGVAIGQTPSETIEAIIMEINEVL